MHKNLLIYISILLCGIVLVLFFWILYPISQKYPDLVTPVPSFLSLMKNKQVSGISLWLPSLHMFVQPSPQKPELTAKAALMYDLTSDKTLFTKNIHKKLPMASLTKIMTAIIALENPKEDNKYLVTKKDMVGEDSMGLTPGEIVSLDELLYGLMLLSGNDAAEVLANNYFGGRKAFVEAMNEKAEALGLTNTHFTNPTGLQGDGDQYTTVYDLLVITKYALSQFPKFRQVVSTYQYVIDYTNTHKQFYLENETNLLTTYPGVRGVKTGFTPEAGLCLVTYLEYKDHKIIGIVLNSQSRREEMKELLDYSLQIQNISPPSVQ